MTHLKEIREDLEVISCSPEGGDFFEERGDFLWTYDEFPLQLHRHPLAPDKKKEKAKGDGRPVLILHGASAGADTFLAPRHSDCLVDYLLAENYEPWLLDWRASKDVADTVFKLHKENAFDPRQPPKGADDIGQLYGDSDEPSDESEKDFFNQLNFNRAAEHDIRRALEAIIALRPGKPIDVIAHCMGAAAMAEALLRGTLVDAKGGGPGRHLSHVVLSTIGVFYQMNLHGRLKAESQLLSVLETDGRHFLHPQPVDAEPASKDETSMRAAWPKDIEALYRAWRVPYDERRFERENISAGERSVFEMFNRLSFMFGEPYQEGNLAPEIHHRLQALTIGKLSSDPPDIVPAGAIIEIDGEPAGEAAYDFKPVKGQQLSVFRCEGDLADGQALFADGRLIGEEIKIEADVGPLLPELFGGMSVDLFRHGAENLRAGMATELGKNGAASVPWLEKPAEDEKPVEIEIDPYEHFKALDHLTLIGGGLNRLWHRDGIDRMADWLSRSPEMRGKYRKEIFLEYGHQDLYWGRNAAAVVFPKIVEGLGPTPPANGSADDRHDDNKGQMKVAQAS